jgi:hypothetical protein
MKAKQEIRNRYYAALVLIAFAFNALLPSIGAIKSASEQIASTNMVFICASGGMKWVSWDDLQSGKDKPEIQRHLNLAAIASATQTLKDFANLEVTEINFVTIAYQFSTQAQTEQSFQSPQLIDGTHSRAPPVLS